MESALRQKTTVLALILGVALPLAGASRGSVLGRDSASDTSAAVAVPGGAPTIGINVGFAMADFTGDSHPDLATVELHSFDSGHAEYVIDVQLTEGGYQILQLSAPFGGILVTPKDVTGDGNLDLVIRSARSQVPVAVFLNDGRGHFSAGDPAAFTRTLRETPSEREFSPHHFFFNATFVSPKSYAANSRSRSARTLQKRVGALFFTNHRFPLQSFLHFGLNRAPPAVA